MFSLEELRWEGEKVKATPSNVNETKWLIFESIKEPYNNVMWRLKIKIKTSDTPMYICYVYVCTDSQFQAHNPNYTQTLSAPFKLFIMMVFCHFVVDLAGVAVATAV